MERANEFELPVHFIMAVFGGFVGAYAILARMKVFGSAQTANLIELVCSVLGRNPEEAVSYTHLIQTQSCLKVPSTLMMSK